MISALPAALALPAVWGVQASTSPCPGTISLGGFSASLVTTHGTGGAAVTIEGSGFPALTSFSNGGTVFFPNGSGNQAVSVTYSGSSSPDGSRLTVPAPNGGYSGQVEVCINGNTAGVLTTSPHPQFSYVPLVTCVPAL